MTLNYILHINIPNKSASNVPSIVEINEYTDDIKHHVIVKKKSLIVIIIMHS